MTDTLESGVAALPPVDGARLLSRAREYVGVGGPARRVAAVFAAYCVGVVLVMPAHADDRTGLPDLRLTPGHVCITDAKVLCSTKWGKDVRHVTEEMKQQVFASYGVSKDKQHLPNGKPAYEIDHLASRENGGCDTVDNLWPQPYYGAWNAHMKDRVENRLHTEICAGRLQPADAVQSLVNDWREAYRHYFGDPP